MDEQGLNDAAIMLMSLGEEEAAEVFKHFSPKEVQKLGETIARMRTVSREKVDEVINKFSNAAAAQMGLPPNVEPWLPGVRVSCTASPSRQTPMGRPPASPLAVVTISGSQSKCW